MLSSFLEGWRQESSGHTCAWAMGSQCRKSSRQLAPGLLLQVPELVPQACTAASRSCSLRCPGACHSAGTLTLQGVWS